MAPALVAPDPPLGDGVLALRALEDSDVPAFARALEDPDVFELAYEGYLAPDEAVVRDYVARFRIRARDGEGILLAFAGADRALAGKGMLYAVDSALRDGEIGFWVAPWARGAGLGARGVRLLAGWALHAVGLERVHAQTATVNGPAQAVLEAAGFTRDGTLRGASRLASGERRDMLSYSLLRTDANAPPDPRTIP